MEIIILITAVILAVSLYDFFTSRSWQQVTSSSRNDVVFGERNKAYGAYQIRRDYDRNLLFILLGVIGSVGIAYGTFMYFRTQPVSEVKLPSTDDFVFPMIEIPIEIDNTPPPIDDSQQPAASGPTDQFVVPIITDIPMNTNPPIQDLLGSNPVGNEPVTGFGNPFTPPTSTTTAGTGGGSGGGDIIEDFVDIDASFPGGIPAMMKYLSKNIQYPERGIQAGAQGRVTLRFVVGKDGKIENVTVAKGVPGCPECDQEAVRVVRGMPKWNPAQNKGKVVKSYFNLPVTFKLQ